MAIEQIPLGQAPYGEDGADARQAFTIVNQNFAELDARSAQNAQDIAGKADSNDARFTDAREWTAATISQAEAEAGSATTRRAWTAVRVWQAIAAWWAASAAKLKLDGIAVGATANSSDATLLNRANHTGTQLLSTISNAGTAAVANVTLSKADTTAGRVMRTGDGGLLGTGVTMTQLPSQSLGDANLTFFYTIDPTMTDRPCEYGAGMHIKYTSQLYGFDFAGDVQTGTFFLRTLGATGLGTWRKIFHEGNLQPIKLVSYTFATLPAASGNNGLMVMCSNLAGGNAPVFSNGTSWLKAADNTAAAAA